MNPRPPGLQAVLTLPSPLGTLTAAATAKGLVVLWFDPPPDTADLPQDPRHPALAATARQLDAYWRDPQIRFDLPLDLHGTPFQRAVWQALCTIPTGQTRSYTELALAAGVPTAAVRAVGAACGANPVAIIVPCHRVIGRNGRLTGYAGGLRRKAALLAHESPQATLRGLAA